MAIPQAFVQELIARADVVEIVGRHVQLKKTGANFVGLCPFHNEKSPSFSVSPSKQFYHCFGCGKTGNAIGFLMEHAGMGFVDAVQDLAQQFGMQVPEDNSTPQERERQAQQKQQQATLTDVLEKQISRTKSTCAALSGPSTTSRAAASPVASPSISVSAMHPRVGAAWPVCSPHTTTPCSLKAAWSS